MNRILPFFIFIFGFTILNAQETDLLKDLGEEETTQYATASFKTNRVVNSHSIENTAAGVLDFKINHRFGTLNTGAYDFFGLDVANTRLCFDYGITNRLQTGIARSGKDKVFDGYLKYKILRQSSGKRNMPISLAYVAGMEVSFKKWANPDRTNYFSSRLSYYHQLIIARKFSAGTSLQLMPILVHRNLIANNDEKNDVFALGIAFRQKITKRIAINIEYFYAPKGQLLSEVKPPLSIGFDIETGGHVFQLHFTNSTFMTETGYLTKTTNDWLDGGIHFGFNISRVFTLVKPKGDW